MKTVAFVPIKLNSERLPLKNIKPFTNGKPLIAYILDTLKNVNNVDEIYVYCSDEKITEYLPEGVKFLKRDPYYDLSTTKFNEVLSSFAKLVEADVYVLTHATAPFMSAQSIEKGVDAVTSGKYESAHAVTLLREFLWKDGKPLNYELDNIPRTQDLPDIYAETCGLYVYTSDLIINKGRRISDDPFLVEITKIEACDINDEDDFIIADAIFNSKFKN
ncbi:MAG: acylneuraminate cytidylyltransferase family protein [Ruminiclostridium sp.]|nr:acylneuraminate cytidylyltransferase family protein [Ruminiclostridium sp.]